MVFVPLFMAFFFVTLLDKGVANQVPSAIVDLDRTPTSRSLTRLLSSFQGVDIKYELNSYSQAMDYVKEGKIVGFIIIPKDFTDKTLSLRKAELPFYINFSHFAAGSLLMKSYTMISILSNGAVVKGALTSLGVDDKEVSAMLQPYVVKTHQLSNPWMNYAIYLCNSFVPGSLALMIMLITAYSITSELKYHTSTEWLKRSGNSIILALTAKLLPRTIIFTLVGWTIQMYFFVLEQYPLNCSIAIMMTAMFLLVIASQGFAVFIACLVPNLRFSLSICSLISMLSFSLSGYSFPVDNMYPELAALSYILPTRYYFLIYIDQALNGIDIAFSRYYFVALLVYPIISLLLVKRLKRACEKPLYVP